MIATIDCGYLERPGFAAAYLLHDGTRAVFVDNNTAHSVPALLRALSDHGLKPEQVEYLIVTHVHLDHAGGTSALLEHCPRATVLAHPRAARHLLDPSRLVASATAVYGKERFESLYGEIRPIPDARVREVGDGETVRFGGRELRFLHTRGHANHHFCILDEVEKAIFTGDAFGLRYPALQPPGGLFIFPSTSPTDFDPAAARESVRRIASSGARAAYPTHFGAVENLGAAAEQLLRHLDAAEETFEDAVAASETGEALVGRCRARVDRAMKAELARAGVPDVPETWSFLEMDLALNAQGIAFAAERERARRKKD